MTAPTKTHLYRERIIMPCECERWTEGKPWTIARYHDSGVLWFEAQCDHYYTLAAAKEAIDAEVEQEEYSKTERYVDTLPRGS